MTESDPVRTAESRADVLSQFGSFVLNSIHEGGNPTETVERLIGDDAVCPYLHNNPEVALDVIEEQLGPDDPDS